MSLSSQIESFATKHPRPDSLVAVYGTAGFRMLASQLDYVNYTVGILAALRSKQLGSTVGVMVTASHNPPQDNGVKVVDPLGSMLHALWEAHATELANTPPDLLASVVNRLCSDLSIDIRSPLFICIGRDSRELSPALSQSTIDGISSLPSPHVNDIGLCTTPQLHYMVRTTNDPAFGEALDRGYFSKMADAFQAIMDSTGSSAIPKITIDCANGVGAPIMQKLSESFLQDKLNVSLINTNYLDCSVLNHQCGADYVKTTQSVPLGIDPTVTEQVCFSFDGDADRLMCCLINKDAKFILLDGDKMASLFASFLALVLHKLPALQLKTGIVQTAYANGALTQFIGEVLKLEVVCTPTGVKHLHHAAEKFDIGVYFEANGHGTVVFLAQAEESIAGYEPQTEQEKNAILVLKAFTRLINQTVGDAILDLLGVMAALQYLGRSFEDWAADYDDLPSRLVRVVVKDRSVFQTTNAERTLVSPPGIQDKINGLVSQYPNARSFVRASGTEDAVRVYAEADTPENVRELADAVSKLLE